MEAAERRSRLVLAGEDRLLLDGSGRWLTGREQGQGEYRAPVE